MSRPDWKTARLKTVAKINVGALPETTDAALEFRYVDIATVGRGSLTGEPARVTFGEAPSRARRLVKTGDTIISTVRTYLRAVYTVEAADDAATLVVSTGFAVLTPSQWVDPRFFSWSVQADAFIEEVVARSVGVSYPAIAPSDLGNVTINMPPLEEQQAIADFLDVETSRIDALIDKKRRLIILLTERSNSRVAELLRSDEHVQLRRISTLLAGYTFPSIAFDAGAPGARLLRGINVGVGEVRWDDTVRLIGDGDGLMDYRLRVDDVVLGMDRPFISGGTRVAVVDSDSAESLLVQRVCRIRPASSDWAAIISETLGSEVFKAHVEAEMTGVSVPHISESQIATTPVPRIPENLVADTAEQLRHTRSRTRHAIDRLTQQIALLEEKRRALITAAVTGEFTVPGTSAA